MQPTLETDTTRVYTTYDTEPPHPGARWTRFICISDTHSRTHWDIPSGDVLIHAGDLTRRGTLEQLKETLAWLANMPHGVKIVVAGNHDACLDSRMVGKVSKKKSKVVADEWAAARALVRSKKLRDSGVVYLERETAEVVLPAADGGRGRRWRVYGDPGTPRYGTSAFQYNRGEEAAERYARVPPETEILVTHGPPAGVLDATQEGLSAGCTELGECVGRLAGANLRLHVFGHLHEAFGAALDGEHGLASVNCALHWTGRPVIVDLYS